MKVCNKCGIDKELCKFNKAKRNKDGHSNQCKECKAKYNKILREKIKFREKITVSGKTCTSCGNYKKITNFNKQISSIDGHRPNCKICQSKSGKIYRELNQDKIKEYRLNNKSKINNQKRHKRNSDVQYKLRAALRSRLWNAISYGYKAGSSVKDLGCSIAEFKIYLESKFTEGMSWDNWSLDGWHIDHKIPLSKFDLTNREELLKAVHYTNLQPMWGKDNLIKGNN